MSLHISVPKAAAEPLKRTLVFASFFLCWHLEGVLFYLIPLMVLISNFYNQFHWTRCLVHLCVLHWLSRWRHPLCLTSTDHRLGLSFLLFSLSYVLRFGYFVLHSIVWVYVRDILVTSHVDLCDVTAESRDLQISWRINSNFCSTYFAQKRTEEAGFEPSNLSMTRLLWDLRSRPLDHHGRVSLCFIVFINQS